MKTVATRARRRPTFATFFLFNVWLLLETGAYRSAQGVLVHWTLSAGVGELNEVERVAAELLTWGGLATWIIFGVGRHFHLERYLLLASLPFLGMALRYIGTIRRARKTLAQPGPHVATPL